jgi:hypothetical protein
LKPENLLQREPIRIPELTRRRVAEVEAVLNLHRQLRGQHEV